jgi:N-acetylglucosamine-6-phosphate deacetylase
MAAPGLVDTHVHGARGVDFADVGVDPQPAIDHHHAAGSTTIVASLATGTAEATRRRVRELRPYIDAGELAGLHLEGPWLSPRRRGAHAIDLLRAPEAREIDDLLEAGAGAIRMVTLAPELPGAIEAIDVLVRDGVVAAIGHSDADSATTARAIDAGASVITHLFNGMAPLHHRNPGMAGTALARDDVAVELIADGVHVDDTVVDVVVRAAGNRLVLVSDAMAAAGLGDGEYQLAGSEVTVTQGIARLADGSSLAGSTSDLGRIAARLLSRGVAPDLVVTAASVRPAQTLSLSVPLLRVGDAADLVIFDGAGVRTLRGGRWLVS